MREEVEEEEEEVVEVSGEGATGDDATLLLLFPLLFVAFGLLVIGNGILCAPVPPAATVDRVRECMRLSGVAEEVDEGGREGAGETQGATEEEEAEEEEGVGAAFVAVVVLVLLLLSLVSLSSVKNLNICVSRKRRRKER